MDSLSPPYIIATIPDEAMSQENVVLDYQSGTQGSAYSEKRLVVIRTPAVLPQRCIKCNCESELVTRQYTLPLAEVDLIPGLGILSHIRVRLTFSICRRHLIRGWLRRFLFSADIALTILFVRWATLADRPELRALAGIGGFAAYIFAVKQVPMLRVTAVCGNQAWLKGAGKAFLASLPMMPNQFLRRRTKD